MPVREQVRAPGGGTLGCCAGVERCRGPFIKGVLPRASIPAAQQSSRPHPPPTTTTRWAEAKAAGKAPPVVLAATHVRALDYVTLAELREHAVDAQEAEAEAAAAKDGGQGECGSGEGPASS